jgi:hypothetical protein
MIVISLIGGAVSVRLFSPKALFGEVIMGEDDKGRHQVGMLMKGGEPVIFISDKEERMRLMTGLAENDTAGISFMDPYGRHQMVLTSSILRKISGLTLLDEQQNPRVILAISPDDNIGLSFYDSSKRTRSFFGISQNGEPFLVFTDEKGEIIWSAPKSIEETKKSVDLID